MMNKTKSKHTNLFFIFLFLPLTALLLMSFGDLERTEVQPFCIHANDAKPVAEDTLKEKEFTGERCIPSDTSITSVPKQGYHLDTDETMMGELVNGEMVFMATNAKLLFADKAYQADTITWKQIRPEEFHLSGNVKELLFKNKEGQ